MMVPSFAGHSISLTNLILQPLQDWQSITTYAVVRPAAFAILCVPVAPAAPLILLPR